jgi:hypothetical protein
VCRELKGKEKERGRKRKRKRKRKEVAEFYQRKVVQASASVPNSFAALHHFLFITLYFNPFCSAHYTSTLDCSPSKGLLPYEPFTCIHELN